jgi:hypothetical protein
MLQLQRRTVTYLFYFSIIYADTSTNTSIKEVQTSLIAMYMTECRQLTCFILSLKMHRRGKYIAIFLLSVYKQDNGPGSEKFRRTNLAI